MTLVREQIEHFRQGILKQEDWKLVERELGEEICDLALKGLQAEEMREAIRRAMEKFERYKQEGMYLLPLDEIRADLEQALNERKET